MAAATLTGSRAKTTVPKGGTGPAMSVQAGWGTVAVDAATEAGDIFEVCWVPGGATIIGGYVLAGDGDTGTESLDIDIGWAANGVDAADSDGLGNLGVWTGDAGEGMTTEPGNALFFGGTLLATGPKTFTVDTKIQLQTVAAAATGVIMNATVVVLYLYNTTA